jgi:hypothetical protein
MAFVTPTTHTEMSDGAMIVGTPENVLSHPGVDSTPLPDIVMRDPQVVIEAVKASLKFFLWKRVWWA